MPTTAFEVSTEINRLRKSGAWQEALDLGEREIANFPGNKYLGSALAWAIYESIKNLDEKNLNSESVAKLVRRARVVTSPDVYGDISPYSQALLKAASLLNSANFSAVALRLLLEADVNQLSIKSSEFEGRTIQSFAAKWYSEVSKCYQELGELDNLERICSQALSSKLFGSEPGRKFFRYRRALALEASNPQEAIAEMDLFLKVSKDWWAYQIKARVLGRVGRTEESIKVFRTALGRIQPVDYKNAVKLLIEFAHVATEENTTKELVQAVRAIRASEKWSTDKAVEEMARSLDLPDAVKFDYVAVIKKYADLSSSTQNLKEQRGEKVILVNAVGAVRNILPGNNHGFVRIEVLGDCYFRGSDNPKIAWPPPLNAKVIGTVVESFDAKRNRTSHKFVNGSIKG